MGPDDIWWSKVKKAFSVLFLQKPSHLSIFFLAEPVSHLRPQTAKIIPTTTLILGTEKKLKITPLKAEMKPKEK